MDTRKKIIIASVIVILIIITVGIFLALKKTQPQPNSIDTNGFPGTDRPSPMTKPISGNTSPGTDTGPSPSSSTSSSSGTSTTVSANDGKGGSASAQTSTLSSESPEGSGLGITIPAGQTNTTTGQSLGTGLNSGAATTTSGGATSTTPGAITPSTDPIENITPATVQSSLNPNDAALVLKPLPVDDPKTTTVNERDIEMKKRVFDIVWRKWDQDPRKVLANKDRQRLYGEFSSIKQNITDAKSLVNSKNLLESIKLQNVDLANGYHDCMIIRDAAVRKNPGTGKPYLSTDTAFWDGIRSQMLTSSLKIALNPEISIIGTSEKHPPSPDPLNDPFWKNFNELMDADDLPGRGYDDTQEDRKPQVFQAMNVAGLLQQDADKTLFCKLPNYFLVFWYPEKLGGVPIGCYPTSVAGRLAGEGQKSHPNFYDVNISEIFYNPGNTGL